VEGETASRADGLDGAPEPGPGVVPTSFARAVARSVDTSFSVLSVMVSFDFLFNTTRIVDPLFVDRVDEAESFLSSREVGTGATAGSGTPLLLSLDGTGGGGKAAGFST
jgi:hypothetical protein